MSVSQYNPEDLVQRVALVVVYILTLPCPVVWRVIDSEASLVENLPQRLSRNVLTSKSTHIVTIIENGICSILTDLGIDLYTVLSCR